MGFEAKIVKDSFELAKPIADKMVKRFYENLYTDFPQSKSLYFEGNLPEQQLAVLKAFIYIVENMDNKEKLGTFLKNLNERYDLGIDDPVTLQWVRSSVMKTLAEVFGKDWTQELSEQWNLAFQTIVSFLLDSSSKKNSSSKPFELATVISFPGGVNLTGLSSLPSDPKCDLPGEVRSNIREEARKTVHALLRKEYQSALNAEIESLTDDSVRAVILKKVA
ncbi:MAG: hypothetical protein EBR01_07460 [Proteobacteria bacterium]|nr:hypothetical protein [Pseudomonadota bacterium]NBY20992.1 hypothetical protein [bacterium]